MKKSLLSLLLISVTLIVMAQSKQKNLFGDATLSVSNLDKINTIGSDICPFFIGNNLYWASVRDEFLGDNSREQKNMAFYSIFSVPLGNDGRPAAKRKLVSGFGHYYHEGPAVWCEQTGELFTTFSNVLDPKIKKGAIRKEDIQLRLAIQEFNGQEWTIKEELPFNNKNYNCAHPAVSVTGDTLVFSSDMKTDSKGRNDLYMSVRLNGKWTNPVNLGDKINTAGNEMFPVFLPGGILSFASDGKPNGKGGLDIWYTTFPEIGEISSAGDQINSSKDDFGLTIREGSNIGFLTSSRAGTDDIYLLEVVSKWQYINGLVVDDRTNKPIAGAKVVLNNCDNKEVTSVLSDKSGKFLVSALKGSCPVLVATKAGYLDETLDAGNLTGLVELRMKQGRLYELVVLDNDTQLPVSDAAITCAGRGNWTSDANGVIRLNADEVSGCNLRISRDGYLNQTWLVDPNRLTGVNNREVVYMLKKQLNKTFALKNIFYNYDKWDILPESEVELDNLVKIMKENPDIKVELGSHTDARGSDEYNRVLSQKRSDSAVGYIIRKGIPASSITAKGYGESQLVNHCANGVKCSDAEHRQNRRTEFKIVSVNN